MPMQPSFSRIFPPAVILALFCTCILSAQPVNDSVQKETFLYSVKGRDSLYLDRYFPSRTGENGTFAPGERPCLIFVFGGGFFTGKKDQPLYIPYYHWLVGKGYNVVAIDYRLGLQPLAARATGPEGAKERTGPLKMVNMLFNSVNMAVEDFYDATLFVLSRSGEWGIDTSRIIGCGSSAGAITVLQGEYYLTNNTGSRYPLANRLPANFKYAGIISFAGAIAKKGGKIKWEALPSPIQLFHGYADSNVPYDKIKTLFGGLYGSKFIAGQLADIEAPYYFLTAGNATHTVATTPMTLYREEIADFLDRMVLKREPLMINETIATAGEPPKNKKIGLKAYLKTNFAAPGNRMKLLSYNVHNCIATDPARTRDYKTIAHIIQASQADVVALQELDSMTSRTPLYVLGELAKETGMHGIYAPAIDYGGGKYGIGILAKEEPLAVKRIPLPGREEPRVFLLAEFRNYIFCSTHLSLTKADRTASVEIIRKAIKDFIRENRERRDKPVFIGGDFNAAPLSATVAEFSRHAVPVSNIRMDTFPSANPDRCIDYIFVYGRKMPRKMQVLSTGRIRDSLTRTASDHLPVYSIVAN